MPYLSDQHEALFRKILRFSLGFYFLTAITITIIHIPPPKPSDVANLPDRVARLILEPSKVTSPPAPPAVTKSTEKRAKAKKAQKKKPPRPSAQRNREIVRKSGLLASLIEEHEGGTLGTIMKSQQLDRALTKVDLVMAAPRKSKRTSVKKNISHKSDLADQKIAHLRTLKKGDRIKLEKGEEVSLASLKGSGSGRGSRDSGSELGSGVGIRLKGSRSGSATASIDYDAIARVVEKYKGGLIYLYNKELRINPTLKGTITVEFAIDSNGKVIEAHVVSSSMDHKSLEKALARRIKMWKFPHLYDGVIVVTYPFVFFPV